MLFLSKPTNAEDIRYFCARFNEGLRVEYKALLDDNVRNALPKIVSSFANSNGGVLVIGVRAVGGVPQQPIEGFQPQPREELSLTVENICLQNLNPPALPRTVLVSSDVPGRVFLVVEVDESWEAPHAIENSKKVYVRTGDASNPYELADVDLIIELVRRRDQPERLRERLLKRARSRASLAVADATHHMEVSIGPRWPRLQVCNLEQTWDFLSRTPWRGAHFFPYDTMRRVEDGAAAFDVRGSEYGELTKYGLILGRKVALTRGEPDQGGLRPLVFDFGQLLYFLRKVTVLANRFYTDIRFRGNLAVSATLRNTSKLGMAAIGQYDWQCFDETVNAGYIIAAELLGTQVAEVLHSLTSQICWSFFQSDDPFPSDGLKQLVDRLNNVR